MHRIIYLLLGVSLVTNVGFSQTNPVIDIFPKGTTLHGNIAYNNDTLTKHLLDIYLPPNAKRNVLEHELMIVPDAPHFGDLFDAGNIRTKVMAFLKKHLK